MNVLYLKVFIFIIFFGGFDFIYSEDASDPGLVLERIALDSTVEQNGITLWKSSDNQEFYYTPRLDFSRTVYVSPASNTIGFYVRLDADLGGKSVTVRTPNEQRISLLSHMRDKIKVFAGTNPVQFIVYTQAIIHLKLLNQEGNWLFRPKRVLRLGELKEDEYIRIDFIYEGPRIKLDSLPPPLNTGEVTFTSSLVLGGKYRSQVEGRISIKVSEKIRAREYESGHKVFIWSETNGTRVSDIKKFVTWEGEINASFNASQQDRNMIERFIDSGIRSCFKEVSSESIGRNDIIRVPRGFISREDLDAREEGLRILFDAYNTAKKERSRKERSKKKENILRESNKLDEEINNTNREKETKKSIEGNLTAGVGGNRIETSGTELGDWSGKLDRVLDKMPSTNIEIGGSYGTTGKNGERSELIRAAQNAEKSGISLDQFLEQGSSLLLGGGGKLGVALNLMQAINFHNSTFYEVVNYSCEKSYSLVAKSYSNDTLETYVVGSIIVKKIKYTGTDSRPIFREKQLDFGLNLPEILFVNCDVCKGSGCVEKEAPPIKMVKTLIIREPRPSHPVYIRCKKCLGYGRMKAFPKKGGAVLQALTEEEAKNLGIPKLR